jgi:hypothetical protein
MGTMISIDFHLKINTVEKFAILSVGNSVLWNAYFENFVINHGVAVFLDDRQRVISKVRNYTKCEIV